MNRDKVLKEILAINSQTICLELATGFGKTKCAIEILKKRKVFRVLIVVPRLVLIKSWEDELKKWGSNVKPIFTTYISLHKHTKSYDCVVFDEGHHLTTRSQEALINIKSKSFIILSATLKPSFKDTLRACFNDITFYKISLKEAIDNNILPDPTIYLLPLTLDTILPCWIHIEHPKGTITKECLYKDRWNYMKDKNIKLKVLCTEFQYVQELDNKIAYYKRLYMRNHNEGIKTKWLQLAGNRLKYLSNLKNSLILELLEKLKNERVLTFCNSILQASILGKYCINSQNSQSTSILSKFNEGKINHITAINMLNEGVNLYDCKIGIYGVLNSSDIMIKQKNGRILRHKEPIIIIPYYVNTREEELVNKMLEDYNPKLIKKIDNINQIKI